MLQYAIIQSLSVRLCCTPDLYFALAYWKFKCTTEDGIRQFAFKQPWTVVTNFWQFLKVR